jgi:uncharacterized protein YegP (UPF0339 family)
MTYFIYKDAEKRWCWRLRTSNGKIIAISSEGYKSKPDCLAAIKLVQASGIATVKEVE